MKNVHQAKKLRHKARRERYSQASPPKALVRMHRRPELIHVGTINPAQMRAMSAVCNEMI